MSPFTYERTPSAASAIASGARHRSDGHTQPGTDFIAGGTDMLQLLKEHLRNPRRIVDISALPDLARIEAHEGGVSLGAMVRMSDAAEHPLIRERYTVMAEALLASASAQVRNLATLGGNLLQRTRCGYFRDPGAPCNKREPSSGCPAIRGENRSHAIWGGSEQCIATYPGDLAVSLLALDATINIAGQSGARSISISDLHRAPGDSPWIETQLAEGELITAIELPNRPNTWRSHYVKVRDRGSFEWALASVAIALDMDDDIVRDTRIAVGGVATTPWRLPAVENEVRGRTLSVALTREAGSLAGEGAVARGRNAYKIELIRRTVARALEDMVSLA